MRVIPVKIKNFSPQNIRLNETADFILAICDGKKKILDIADAYRKRFNITLSASINDCIEALEYFEAVGLIKFI